MSNTEATEIGKATPEKCSKLAEDVVITYVTACGATTPQDIENFLEMLISKAARGIEKYRGNEAALGVLSRTAGFVERNPATYGEKH